MINTNTSYQSDWQSPSSVNNRLSIFCCHSNKEGQMGSGGSKAHPSPFHVKSIKDHQVLVRSLLHFIATLITVFEFKTVLTLFLCQVIACGDTYTAAGTSNGILLYWGTRFGNFTSSSSGGLLQPPGSDKGHRRTMSTTSTLSVRSCSRWVVICSLKLSL